MKGCVVGSDAGMFLYTTVPWTSRDTSSVQRGEGKQRDTFAEIETKGLTAQRRRLIDERVQVRHLAEAQHLNSYPPLIHPLSEAAIEQRDMRMPRFRFLSPRQDEEVNGGVGDCSLSRKLDMD